MTGIKPWIVGYRSVGQTAFVTRPRLGASPHLTTLDRGPGVAAGAGEGAPSRMPNYNPETIWRGQEPADTPAQRGRRFRCTETAGAGNVRLGRRLAGSLTSQHAKDVHRSWLEGCIWAAARASGLDWDQWRCAVAADVLRKQQGGWELAMVRAVDEPDAAPGAG